MGNFLLNDSTVELMIEKANAAEWEPVARWLMEAGEVKGEQAERAMMGMATRVNDPVSMLSALLRVRGNTSTRILCHKVRAACAVRSSVKSREQAGSAFRQEMNALGDQLRELASLLFAAWKRTSSTKHDPEVLSCWMAVDASGIPEVLSWLVDAFLKPELGMAVQNRLQAMLDRMKPALMQRADLIWRILSGIRGERGEISVLNAVSLMKSFGSDCPRPVMDELLAIWRDRDCRGRRFALELLSTLPPPTYGESDVRELVEVARHAPPSESELALRVLNQIVDRVQDHVWVAPLIVVELLPYSAQLQPPLSALLHRCKAVAGPEEKVSELDRLARQLRDSVRPLRANHPSPNGAGIGHCTRLDPVLIELAKFGSEAAEYPGVVEDICYLLQAWRTYPDNVDEACRTLGLFSNISVSTARVIPMLLQWLGSEEPYVASNVADALFAMRSVLVEYPGAVQQLRQFIAQPDHPACGFALDLWSRLKLEENSALATIELLVPCLRSENKWLSARAVGLMGQAVRQTREMKHMRKLLRGVLRNSKWHVGPIPPYARGRTPDPRASASAQLGAWAAVAKESPLARKELLRALSCPVTSPVLFSKLSPPRRGGVVRSWAADEVLSYFCSYREDHEPHLIHLIASLDLCSAMSETHRKAADLLGVPNEPLSSRLDRIYQELERLTGSPPATRLRAMRKRPHRALIRRHRFWWRKSPDKQLVEQLLKHANLDSTAGLCRLFFHAEPSAEELGRLTERVRFLLLDGTKVVDKHAADSTVDILARWLWIYQRLIPDTDPGYQDLAIEIVVWGLCHHEGFISSWVVLLQLLSDLRGAAPEERHRFVEGLMFHVERSRVTYSAEQRELFLHLMNGPASGTSHQ